MTKDKIIKFGTYLPHMDPEVAKKALEQFPAFAELASAIVCEYKLVVEKALEGNTTSQTAFFDSCNKILDSLKHELEKEDISPEERSRIEDKMLEVAHMLFEKDSENKKFLLKILKIVAGTAGGIILTAATAIGVKTWVDKNNTRND